MNIEAQPRRLSFTNVFRALSNTWNESIKYFVFNSGTNLIFINVELISCNKINRLHG